MRSLILASCLLVCIYAVNQKYDFQIKFDKPLRPIALGQKIPLNRLNGVIQKMLPKLKPIAADGTEAILNDYADEIFENVRTLIVEVGMDPLSIPDQEQSFDYKLGLIDFHGEIGLTNGWLSDLSLVSRGGDVIAQYSSNTKYLDLTIPITFGALEFDFDYSATIMDLGPKGGIDGKIEKLTVEVKLGFNVVELQASLDDFYILNSGEISLEFNGNALVDWLLNLLTDVVTTLLKEVILLVIESVVRTALGTAVDAINDFIDSALNPVEPTDAPANAFLKYIK